MKLFITTLFLSLFALIALGQAPQLISYQAEIRNNGNNLIINQQVGMRFSILLGSITGTPVYVETHSPTTNANGLVSLQLGGGTVQSGNFASINWGNGAYYLKSETDPTGGSNYTITGTQQLLSVPYALYSNRSGNGLNNGTAANQMLYWNGSAWVTVAPPSAQCQVLTYCGNQIIWTTGGVCPGCVSTINCAGATNSGTLTAGVSASGVSSSIPYTSGAVGAHTGQIVSSTGVTGLTATLTPGNFANGNGTLVYTITGTPVGCGTATFLINVGGLTCVLTRSVACNGVIATLNCAGAVNSGTLTQGTAASSVSSSIPYTGGNSGSHSGQTVTSTGVTGLTATLIPGSFVSGASNLLYTITGTPVGCGTASFVLNIGGRTCTLTRTVACNGVIATLNCAGAVNSGTLTQGTAASSVSSSVPYTGGNGGSHSGQTVTSTGVTGLTATLQPGSFVSGAANLVYTITGTPVGCGTASFVLNIGGQTCILTRTVNCPVGSIGSLNCAGATTIGVLVQGVAAQGVSVTIPYTGGNGGTHNGQLVNSTGVTGLQATFPIGSFANGAGSITYTITGTPSAAGSANFAISIGGQTCTLVVTVLSGLPHTCGTPNVHNPTKTYGTMTDQQGNTYRTIVIGTQEWMAENLRTTTYRNGNPIPLLNNDTQWSEATSGAYCFPNGNLGLVCPYGNLYNQIAVTDSRQLCPAGWHAPSAAEFNTLINFLGGISDSGRKMKTTTLWTVTGYPIGTNESGFSGVPAGVRTEYVGETYSGLGTSGTYWSTDLCSGYPFLAGKALKLSETNEASNVEHMQVLGAAVRCVRD